MDDLYHQEILDHYHHPDNYGELKNADLVIEETNASCGDSFTFYVKLKSRDRSSRDLPDPGMKSPGIDVIEDLSFTGTGCAISTAACSMLTGKLKGQPLSALKKLDLDYMQALIGAQITPTRLKCLLLPAKALNSLIDNNNHK